MTNTEPARVAVLGATGHTGRFVVAELLRRQCVPVLVGRDAAKLEAQRAVFSSDLDMRVASTDDAESLRLAFKDAAVVINCAGPFLDTARPTIEAALAAGAHYLDVTAEQAAAKDAFESFDTQARDAVRFVVPAMAFYGGLADLMASAVMEGWEHADTLDIGIALDSWRPTRGTRATGERNTVPRVFVKDGRLTPLPTPAPEGTYEFPPPFGNQEVIAVPFSEIITIARHLPISNVNTVINRTPIEDIRNPGTPPPEAADDDGRSSQKFMMDVVATRDGQRRRVSASGRDIYAITAPIVVEAAVRILDGRVTAGAALKGGVFAAGELFSAKNFLDALSAKHLSVRFESSS